MPAGVRLFTGKVDQPPWGRSFTRRVVGILPGTLWVRSGAEDTAGPDTCSGLSALDSPGLCRAQCCCWVSGFLDAGHLQVSVLLQGLPVTHRKTAAPGRGGRGLGAPQHKACGVTVCRGPTRSTHPPPNHHRPFGDGSYWTSDPSTAGYELPAGAGGDCDPQGPTTQLSYPFGLFMGQTRLQ